VVDVVVLVVVVVVGAGVVVLVVVVGAVTHRPPWQIRPGQHGFFLVLHP
jgi:hypothetical protein